jgi:hypothetical protein
MQKQNNQDHTTRQVQSPPSAAETESEQTLPVDEVGGYKGPEPTRFGDWEKNGRCIDF